jgi:hypothetical protein
MISNRSPVELETKFAPEMLRFSTAEAREENSVAAAKEVCAAFILFECPHPRKAKLRI